jgi:hypothetical protein
MRPIRGIPKDLEKEAKELKKGQSCFRRKGDVLMQVWKDKRLVRMISTIHDSEHVHTGKKDRKTNEEISKPNCSAIQQEVHERCRSCGPISQLLLNC